MFKKLILLSMALLLAGCLKTPEEFSLADQTSVVVFKPSFIMNEQKDGKLFNMKSCYLHGADETGKPSNPRFFHGDWGDSKYVVMEVSGNIFQFNELICEQQKDNYIYGYRYKLSTVKASVQKGQVNYLGNLTFDWKVKMIIPPSLISLAIKREDDLNDVTAYIHSLPKLKDAPVVSVPFQPSKLIAN